MVSVGVNDKGSRRHGASALALGLRCADQAAGGKAGEKYSDKHRAPQALLATYANRARQSSEPQLENYHGNERFHDIQMVTYPCQKLLPSQGVR